MDDHYYENNINYEWLFLFKTIQDSHSTYITQYLNQADMTKADSHI